MNLAKASIVLETVSFFLVTIDLLGRKRIEVLQDRFEQLISGGKNIDLKASYTFLTADDPGQGGVGCLYGCPFIIVPVAGVCVLGTLFIWGYILSSLAKFLGEPFELLICLGFPLTCYTAIYPIVAVMFLVRNAGYFLVFLLENIIDGIFTIVLSLFNRLRLEGVMLIVGALLFLISKTLAYINVSYN